jgi:hypothetical protein
MEISWEDIGEDEREGAFKIRGALQGEDKRSI